MKHIWEDARFGEKFFDFQGVYVQMVANCRPTGHLVELGCWKGRSTAFLCVEAYAKSPAIRVYAVDPWKETPLEVFLENVRPVSACLTVMQMTSSEAASQFEDGSLDGVFIDGDHASGAVTADIQAWRPKVKAGGILAGHDYSSAWPGVISAVDALCPDRKIVGQSWVVAC